MMQGLKFYKHNIKLVTFDITGTLLRFRKSPVQIYIETAKEHGIMVTEPILFRHSFKIHHKRLSKEEPHFGQNWKKWWTDLVISTFQDSNGQGLSNHKLEILANDLIRRFSTDEFWELRPGTMDLLEFLKNRVNIGVISNFDSRLHQILNRTGILPYFDFVLTSHECQISKPDSKIFQLGFNLGKILKPNLKPKNILHIGDNYDLDYVGAVNVGWNACLIIQDEGYKVDSSCLKFSDLKMLCHEFKIGNSDI